MSILKFIMVSNIENPVSRGVLDELYNKYGSQDQVELENGIYLKYTPQDPDFYAFLGIPTSSGLAKALTTYANQFATRADGSNPNHVTKLKTINNIIQNVVKYKATGARWVTIYRVAVTLEDVDPPEGFVETERPVPVSRSDLFPASAYQPSASPVQIGALSSATPLQWVKPPLVSPIRFGDATPAGTIICHTLSTSVSLPQWARPQSSSNA